LATGLHQVSILLDVSRVSLGQEKDRLEIQEVHDLLSLAKVRDTAGYPSPQNNTLWKNWSFPV
jgi:hypothetical protein